MSFNTFKPVFARSFASASSQYMEAASSPVSGTPFIMAAWVLLPSVGSTRTIMSAYTSGGSANNRFTLSVLSTAAVEANARTTGNGAASTTATVTAGVWAHVAGYFESSTSRYAYLNGSAGAQNTTSRAPSGMDRLAIGRKDDSASPLYHNGYVAEPCILSAASKSEADAIIAELYAGASPSDIVAGIATATTVYSFGATTGDEVDSIAGLVAVNNGSLVTMGPGQLVRWVSRRRRQVQAAAAPAGGQPTMRRWNQVPHMGGKNAFARMGAR